MNFDELDKKLRVFETTHDICVLPNVYMVARLDGRGFTKLTKEILPFEKPFDIKFRDAMVQTVIHLMNTGFKVIYAFTQSDEISLLFHIDENLFGRKTRKYNSVLAGEASACFALQIGRIAGFDCRISELPRKEDVWDYFSWRNEDAHRNALNAYCYWKLREEGSSPKQATSFLEKMSVSAKNELLFQRNINFNDLPSWQKRGIGFFWENYSKESINLKTQEKVIANRKRIKIEYELPMKNEYRFWLEKLMLAEAGI